MRLVLLLMFIIVASLPSAAQPTSYGNFKVSDQEIVYQKVFLQDTITIEKLAEFYKKLPLAKDVTINGEELTFK